MRKYSFKTLSCLSSNIFGYFQALKVRLLKVCVGIFCRNTLAYFFMNLFTMNLSLTALSTFLSQLFQLFTSPVELHLLKDPILMKERKINKCSQYFKGFKPTTPILVVVSSTAVLQPPSIWEQLAILFLGFLNQKLRNRKTFVEEQKF